MNGNEIDDRIAQLEQQISSSQNEIVELRLKKQRLHQLANIPHCEAVDKLREIWDDAHNADDALGFIVELRGDDQLRKWFGRRMSTTPT